MREPALPYVEPVPQRLRAWRNGQLLVDTRRAHLYFVDALHPQWAVPAEELDSGVASAATDRHEELIVLDPDAADTWVEEDQQTYGSPRSPHHCVDGFRSSRQYKGEATSDRVRGTDVRAWTYRYPEAGLAVIAGHLAVAGELPGVDIVVDGNVEKHR
jgi:uncharacterized protein (DUF427 family)